MNSKVGRQHTKAPLAPALSPFMSLLYPPNPWCHVWRLARTPDSTSPTPFKQWCGFFYVRFSSLSGKTRKSTWSNRLQMSLERQHFLLSYLKSLSVVPAGVRTPDLPLSRPALPHCWANQGAVILRTLINSKTGFGNLKWFPSSVSLTVSCSWGCEQKTMGTFSGDAKDAGKGKLENEII